MEKVSSPINPVIACFSPTLVRQLALHEQRRDAHWGRHFSAASNSLFYKGTTFRHLNHLLPQQTILELGGGKGYFTQQLRKVCLGQNHITTINFSEASAEGTNYGRNKDELEAPSFDLAVGIDLLDSDNYFAFFQSVYQLLKPSGQLILFQKQSRSLWGKWSQNSPVLPSREQLLEAISEAGFIEAQVRNYDFVYGPLAGLAPRFLRNMSVLLENTPGIQHFSDSLIISLQKPPRQKLQPVTSLCFHPELKGAFSVVIPCHNEEMNVGPLLADLKGFYQDYLHEIILVDDNSTDGTAKLLQSMAALDPLIKPLFRKPPNGVGLAIADGLQAATGKYVLTMDCDFQHLLPELKDMFEAAAQGYDVVVGSRFSRHSVLLDYPLAKIVANRGFHLLAKLLLRKNFRDLTNNLKIMRRTVVDNLQLTQPGFGANAETGFKPLLMGYSVKEIPMSWINRTPEMGVSSFKLMKVGSGYVKVLWELCKQTRFGSRQLPLESSGLNGTK
ncbi:MAG: glycosyltransferase [Saprospiraceae bacterium]